MTHDTSYDRGTESHSAAPQDGTMSLLTSALDHVSALIRGEINLARAEIGENIDRATGALFGFAIGLVFAIVALNAISAAFVAWLTTATTVGTGLASLIVAAVFGLIALVLVMRGRSALKARALAPTRTADSLRKDGRTLKETTNAH